MLLWPGPALAATWYETGTSPDQQEHQWIDLDSITPLGRSRVQIKSRYANQRSEPPEISTYLTEYDCQSRQFRDRARNGQPYSQPWMSAAGDPLNAETLKAVCTIIEAIR
ncbi:hypothetical protein C7271_06990 [filamentous cyanobacterium CCP5]|nr:hypothetical protein C7271_06990 [filamentous cyanobacterium CCP5]